MASMHEEHYCHLESQSNVYGLTKFAVSPEENKLLIASLRGKVLCMSFQKNNPCSRDVHFTYIPGDSEIIAIDAFNKSSHGSGVIVAIAFIKCNDGKPDHYLNIYSEGEIGADFDIDRIAQGCQTLVLKFVPYHLYHIELHNDDRVEVVFLLSGGDQSIHLFREDSISNVFFEDQLDKYFPELVDLPGIVIRMCCVHLSERRRRITAIGCQNGVVSVRLVDTSSNEVLKSFTVNHDSPITSVQLFELTNRIPVPPFVQQVVELQSEEVPSFPEFHLVVSSSLELTVVYTDVVEHGLADALLLPESDSFDCVLCTLVTDVDFDGQKEIILGTYGQELLAYKFQHRPLRSHKNSSTPSDSYSKSPPSDASSSFSSSGGSQGGLHSGIASNGSTPHTSSMLGGEFYLLWKRSLPDPILALEEVDLTADGLNEIAVLSLKGLHILQHDLKAAGELVLQRLQQVAEFAQRRDRNVGDDIFRQFDNLPTLDEEKLTDLT